MKTITERDGKNVNMQVVGDLHKYPDGSVHTVKNGKDVWEEGGGGSGGGYNPYVVEIEGGGTDTLTTDADFNTAKTKFLACEPVIARLEMQNGGAVQFINFVMYVSQEVGGSMEHIAALVGSAVIKFNSDGTIVLDTLGN